ncbi:MAG: ABC transporter permease [Planctomycetes bacterium]|nr:ABC transporter permease [Planctomycetota bacterium]
MGSYLVRRLLLMIPTLLGITFLVFALIAMAPGGIGAGLQVQGGQLSDTSKVMQMQAYLEDRYGLNDPIVVQYVRWLGQISPVKIGLRDQVSPSGEQIHAPREIPQMPLQGWFAPPPMPEAAVIAASDQSQDPQIAFQSLRRNSEGTRRTYVGQLRVMKEALADYARAAGLADRLDAKGSADFEKFEGLARNPDLPAFAKLRDSAMALQQAWVEAQRARLATQRAFDGKPYPESGFSIIPGTLWVGAPDLGVAFSKNRPVMDLILSALPVTLLLNLIAFPIIYMIAIPTGMLAATRRGTWFDTSSGLLVLALWSVPTVLAGVVAIGFLANNQYLGWFPVSGLHDSRAGVWPFLPTETEGAFNRGWLLDTLWHVALPVACLTYGGFAVLTKQCRAAMLDNLSADYVRTAKAKGVPRRDVVLRHVFRNSLLPLITMFVNIFPAMLAGSIVIERIFSVPGMGTLILEAIDLRDRELILADTFMIACVNLLALLLADVLYALADPRVSYD